MRWKAYQRQVCSGPLGEMRKCHAMSCVDDDVWISLAGLDDKHILRFTSGT